MVVYRVLNPPEDNEARQIIIDKYSPFHQSRTTWKQLESSLETDVQRFCHRATFEICGWCNRLGLGNFQTEIRNIENLQEQPNTSHSAFDQGTSQQNLNSLHRQETQLEDPQRLEHLYYVLNYFVALTRLRLAS